MGTKVGTLISCLQCCKRFERSVLLGPSEGWTRQDIGLGTDAFGRCQPRARGVEYHSFRPFIVRMDPEVDPLIRGNFRMWCMGNGSREAPISGKQHHEKDAPNPHKIPT